MKKTIPLQPVISRAHGKIYIDGVPALEIGALVARHCAPNNILPMHEVALCKECRKIKPIHQMGPVRENRRGYFGTCNNCMEAAV